MLRQATENNPQYAQAFVEMWVGPGGPIAHFPEAEQALRSALKMGKTIQALTVLAMVLARTGRQAEAVTYFRKVIALDPKVPGSHINLGITLADQFNLEGASRNFRKPYVSIRMPPRPTTTRGACCSTCGATAMPSPNSKPPRAWTQSLPVLVLTRSDRKIGRQRPGVSSDAAKGGGARPHEPRYPICAGTELLRSGDRDGAIAQWRKVIEIKPDHAEALYNLSRQLARSDPQEAQQFQRRFDTLQSQKRIMDRAQTLGNFGLSAAAAHDWPQAIAQLKEGLQVCGQCSALALLHKNLASPTAVPGT